MAKLPRGLSHKDEKVRDSRYRPAKRGIPARRRRRRMFLVLSSLRRNGSTVFPLWASPSGIALSLLSDVRVARWELNELPRLRHGTTCLVSVAAASRRNGRSRSRLVGETRARTQNWLSGFSQLPRHWWATVRKIIWMRRCEYGAYHRHGDSLFKPSSKRNLRLNQLAFSIFDVDSK